MKSSINTKSFLVKILALLLLFNMTVLGNNEVNNESSIPDSSIVASSNAVLGETVEVSLDSFSNMGILIMVALSSLLGAFFVRDEFTSLLE